MEATFDENGCAYIYVVGDPHLREKVVARTKVDEHAQVNVDYDDDGAILGIEVILGKEPS